MADDDKKPGFGSRGQEPKKKPIKELKMAAPEGAAQSQPKPQESGKEKGGQAIERIQAHAERFLEVDEELPLSHHLILLTTVFIVVTFILWASWATLDEVTRGDGTVIPSSEVQKIASLEGGIIEDINVRKGDEVKAGDVLVRLSDVAASSDLGSNEQRYLGLLATVLRLQAETEGKTPEFPENVTKGVPQSVVEELNAYRANKDKIANQTSIMEQQKSQREQELNELRVKANGLTSELNLIKQEKAMVEPLVQRGSAPQQELLQLEQRIKQKQTELSGVNAGIPRAQSAIAEAEARINDVISSFRAQAQTELVAKRTEMQAIREGLSGLQDRKDRTAITSPVAGYIKDMQVNTIGGVVQPGQQFIEIVPKDDQLLVEAKIRPKDIAFLYPDQPAVVKITAYDFSIYGGLTGRLISISPDAITNEKGESFYLVRIRTDKNALERKGEILPIIPGMVASVDILTGKKSVMDYILKPFKKTLDNAMNER